MNRREKIEKLLLTCRVASCTCLTKTPNPKYHSEVCPYKVLNELEKEVTVLLDALDEIGKHQYGLQNIMEEHSHDTNVYNYHAKEYYSKECYRLQTVARNATKGKVDK